MMITSEKLDRLEWMTHMRTGNWAAAWRISDRALRNRPPLIEPYPPRHLQSIWDGSPLEARRVLVRCYHGMGDTVQFIRFMPLLKRIARETVVWCQPQLVPLLQTARGIDVLLGLHDGNPAVEYDVDIELMELPHALRTTVNTLPCSVPYFSLPGPSPDFTVNGRLRVGIVWQSGSWDPQRSVDPRLLEPMMRTMTDIDWQILQRGPALNDWGARPGAIPALSGILEEARALTTLDLLISVDTLSAHLAGALGVPTWTLLPHDADWRWMNDRDDTPWYPTMRLYRQRNRADWSEVIAAITTSLHRLLQQTSCPV
jgi:hypothetical protein